MTIVHMELESSETVTGFDEEEDWISFYEFSAAINQQRRKRLNEKITKATNSYIHAHAYLSMGGLRYWLACFNWGKFFTRSEYIEATYGGFLDNYDWRFPDKNDPLQITGEPLINQWIEIRKMIEENNRSC